MATLYDKPKRGRRDSTDAVYLDRVEPPAKGRRIIADHHRDAPRGFAARVNANGLVTFVLRYQHSGRDRLVTVGEYPTWTLTAARERAGGMRREIDQGADILEQRRREKTEPTVAEAVETFCRQRADRLASGRDIRTTFRLHLVPALGRMRLKEVRRRDIIPVIESLAETHGRAASLLLTYTKQLFAWAEDREVIDANPVATLKPHRISQNMAPRSRERVLDEDEIKALWNAEAVEGITLQTLVALKLVLVTGQRPGEVAGMRWSEIHGKTWVIPAERRGKTATEHRVPLTETALALLKGVQAREGEDIVFARRRRQALTVAALGRAVSRCADTLGNKGPKHWTPHDLRRTCRTGLAAAGVSEVVAEIVIGHTRKGIAATYDQHKYEREKRKALEAWERRLGRIGAGDVEPADERNVLSIGEEQA